MNGKEWKIVEKKNLWLALSTFLIGVGFLLMVVRAFDSRPILNFGIDFSGGSTLVLKFDGLTHQLAGAKQDQKKSVTAGFIHDVRSALAPFGLKSSEIQVSDAGEVIIKTIQMDGSMHEKVKSALETRLGHCEVLEVDFIGPTIGSELKHRSIWIVLLVSLGLMIYMTWRFEFAFGIATLAATLHDALFILSFASIFYLEINVEFVAALLTIIGYSMNDTVVIFDRIRENLAGVVGGEYSIESVTNGSLVQTFKRTILTVVTTLTVTASLLIFGGTTIRDFSLILFAGILIGTYSSIFVAAPVFVVLFRKLPVKNR